MRKKSKDRQPLVYSCSGCSSAAQMANHLALKLDRDSLAEMSCIAGVGGGVAPLVNMAKSNREIIGIDGCPLQCVKNCLEKHDIVPDYHFILSEYQVRKVKGKDFDQQEAGEIYEKLKESCPKGHAGAEDE